MWKICLISILAAVQFANKALAQRSSSCPSGYACVDHYLCSKSGTINQHGEGLIPTLFRDKSRDQALIECGDNPAKVKYCCAILSKSGDRATSTRTTDGCGFRNGLMHKITGESEADFAEFPWMLMILTKNEAVYKFKCGGSLIAPSVVLTAAHNVRTTPANEIKVRAGEWNVQSENERFKHQDRDVVEVVIHPRFHEDKFFNDAALLFLESGFELEFNIKPICLPLSNYNFDNVRCFATGWGQGAFGASGQYPSTLKKIELPTVPNGLCEEQLLKTHLGYQNFKLDPSFICAGGEAGRDTCTGDGGSPLVCPVPNTPNRYYQAGIVSWGIGCGTSNVPGVYTSVARLRPWIDEQLQSKAIDPAFYTL